MRPEIVPQARPRVQCSTRARAADWHGDTTRVARVRAQLARLP
jgi:hypothetical protein